MIGSFTALALASLSIAQHYWSGRPDNCRTTIVAQGTLDYTAAAIALPPRSDDIFPGLCAVIVHPKYGARDFCKLVVHEVGHLHGVGHSTDPNSVMYTPFNSAPTPWGCRKLKEN